MSSRHRISIVTPVIPGQEERNGFAPRLLALLSELIAAYDIDLFLPRHAESISPSAIRHLRGHEAITLHFVLGSRRSTRSTLVRRALRILNHSFGVLPTWSSPRRSRDLTRHLIEGRADVLCLHLPGAVHLAASAPSGLPVIAMLEEDLERYLLAPSERSRLHRLAARAEHARARRLYRRTNRRVAIATAISPEEAASLSAAGIDPDLIEVVPHGLDLSYFAPAGGVEPEFDVAVFGDFRFARNLDPALDALRWAAVHHPQLRWMVTGDIHEKDAETLRSTGATVTGPVADMRPYYSDAKVVLVPATEGTGVKTTLLQAWAMARPVVATQHSIQGVDAVHGENVLVGRTTPELVALCAQLVESSHLRQGLAAQGRRTLERNHDMSSISAGFASLVTALVECPETRPGTQAVPSRVARLS